ncbi:alpha/beta fold hydrolase [Nocardia sp. NPDC052254]|uniref:alpha/beta hydrolase family protein n=1 Tax=Nocardia sp. NPDC052254 TaxID=3155681 RepID=UPI003448A06A
MNGAGTGGVAAARLVAALLVAVVLTSCGQSGRPPVKSADPGDAGRDFAKVTASTNVDATRYLYPTTTGSRDDRQNWVDLFRPRGEFGNGTVPLVILIHGGAWQARIGADSFVTLARRLAERGLAVLNVEYRRVGSGGGWPTTFEDVAAAVDFVPEVERAQPMIDTRNAIVVGHSAGGQLAMWAGTRGRLTTNEIGAGPKFSPTHAISLAGPLDMRRAVALGDGRIVTALGGTPQQVPDRYDSVDPIENIDPRMPVIAMGGSADKTVPPSLSQRYVDTVKAAGGTAEFVLVDRADHSSIVDPAAPAFRIVLETISLAAHDAVHP